MYEALLEMRKINKYYNGNRVLKDISITFNRCEVHALVGENGAGKSTLMRILAGVEKMDDGEIFIDGKKVNITNARDAQKLGISIIFQDDSLFPDLNINENLFVSNCPMKKLGPIGIINWKQINELTGFLLDKYNLKGVNPRMPVRYLGLSQRKMLEVIKAIIFGSRIIIMDETTSVFTEKEVDFLFETINELKKMQVTIIYISHRINEVKRIADRVTVLRDGKCIITESINKLNTERIIKTMIGDEIKDRYPKLEVSTGNEVLRVENLCSNSFLSDISFSLHKREILGFAGLSGSGKTTLAKCLFGVEPVNSGTIYINGKKEKINSTEDAIKNGLSYIPNNIFVEGLIQNASILQNITLTNLRKTKKHGLISKKLEAYIANSYIKQLEIKASNITELARNLSAGNQKKVLLSKWLFTDSMIFILNEPTSQIDICSKVDIYNIINELVLSGASFILISSELSELIGMCDRILVIYNGRMFLVQ